MTLECPSIVYKDVQKVVALCFLYHDSYERLTNTLSLRSEQSINVTRTCTTENVSHDAVVGFRLADKVAGNDAVVAVSFVNLV